MLQQLTEAYLLYLGFRLLRGLCPWPKPGWLECACWAGCLAEKGEDITFCQHPTHPSPLYLFGVLNTMSLKQTGHRREKRARMRYVMHCLGSDRWGGRRRSERRWFLLGDGNRLGRGRLIFGNLKVGNIITLFCQKSDGLPDRNVLLPILNLSCRTLRNQYEDWLLSRAESAQEFCPRSRRLVLPRL